MEFQSEFENVDVLPIGEDVRHLDVKYAMLFAEQETK